MLLLLLQRDPEVRRQLASGLREKGVLVETASTGSQAVNKAILTSPDVVVIDTAAPDAVDTAGRLKRTLVTRRIPLVALADGPLDVPQGEWAAVVARGADVDELLSAARRVMGRRRGDE